MKFAEGWFSLRVPALYFLFFIFLFFPIPELSVSNVDRPVPKNDGRG
jgi:membrane-anchored glycerophosphoryl diester phosphodiesterase (GDPDase)